MGVIALGFEFHPVPHNIGSRILATGTTRNRRFALLLAQAGRDRIRFRVHDEILRLSAWFNSPRGLLTLNNYRPLGSVVEHSLHTRGVSSSNLLAGTINLESQPDKRDLAKKDPMRFAPRVFQSHALPVVLVSQVSRAYCCCPGCRCLVADCSWVFRPPLVFLSAADYRCRFFGRTHQ